MTIKNKNISLPIVLVLVILVVVVVGIGIKVLAASKHTDSHKTQLTSNNKKIAKPTGSAASLATLVSSSCNTDISLVQSTDDYIVDGMECYPAGETSKADLICNGTIFQSGSSVDIECYQPDQSQSFDQLICNGSTDIASLQISIPISYSCVAPSLNNATVYSCSGDIGDQAQDTPLSLPMSLGCSS